MEERGLSLLFQEYPPLILAQRHSYVDFGCLKDDIACLKVRAQFLFSLRFRAQIFFYRDQGNKERKFYNWCICIIIVNKVHMAHVLLLMGVLVIKWDAPWVFHTLVWVPI